jgi:NAD(P)H-dependent flavin oxidoreductase YrpB (nitropropane dioxygenase family)
MQSDLEKFIQATGSSNVNLSFEASLITEPERVLNMIKTFKIPTIEVIYGQYLTTTFWMSMSPEEIDRKIKSALEPIHDLGVKIFKRALEPHTPEQMHRHFIDGLMIKGSDAAGAANQNYTVKELFLQQKKLTPDAYLVPYGGVGTADQVREYLELGAETVGIGTLFAASEESLLKHETKLAMIKSSSKNLKTFPLSNDIDHHGNRQQLALKFNDFVGPDDFNHSESLKHGIWKKDSNKGHVFAGHGIDHITEILPCREIIQKLTTPASVVSSKPMNQVAE